MKYRLPKNEDLDILKEYVAEHFENNESIIHACAKMTDMDYYEWVEKVNRNAEKADDRWGRNYTYLAFDNNEKLVGLLSIRFDLAEDLRQKYGDIGYGVRPSERRKGYATKMLKYALDVCKEKGMEEAIVACYDNNFGSKKNIINNGGIMYKEEYEEAKIGESWPIKVKRNNYKIEL